jgi:hypothetical protein
VDDRRILHLGETSTWGVTTSNFLRPIMTATLPIILGVNRRTALNELLFLVPEIAPALGHKLTLLSKDTKHARDWTSQRSWKRTRDGNWLGPVDIDRLRLEVG